VVPLSLALPRKGGGNPAMVHPSPERWAVAAPGQNVENNPMQSRWRLSRSVRHLDASGNSAVHFQYSEIVEWAALRPSTGAFRTRRASRAQAPLHPKAAEKISFANASIGAINPLPKPRPAARSLLFPLRYRRLSRKSPSSRRARPIRARKEDVSCDRSSHCSATRPHGSAAVLRRSSRLPPPACRRPAPSFPPLRRYVRRINSVPPRVGASV